MSHRIFNFSAGPAMLPTEALEKSAQALVEFANQYLQFNDGKLYGSSHRSSSDVQLHLNCNNY